MTRSFLDFTFYLSMIGISVPIIILLIKFKGQPREVKWLTFALISSLLCDLLSEFTVEVLHRNPNIWSLTYSFFVIPFISVFFFYSIGWGNLKRWFVAINIVYIALLLVNFILVQRGSFNSYTLVLRTIIILLYSVIYFYKLIREMPSDEILKLPLFWLCAGLFFTSAGKLILYGVTNYLISILNDNLIVLWSIHNLISIFGSIIIAVGAWLYFKQAKSAKL